MRLRLILVGLFLALMSLYFGVHGYYRLSLTFRSSYPGWFLSPVDGRVRITHGLSNADVSALRDGDEVVGLNGQQFSKSFRLIMPETRCLSTSRPEVPTPLWFGAVDRNRS